MSSPIDPLAQTSAPVPSPVPTSGQQASDDQIRLLAEQINNAGQLGFQAATFTKAVVQSIAEGDSSTAPTISLYLSGDATTLISGVRFLATYSPTVGDTVIIMKQGSDITAIAQYARRNSSAVSSSTEGGWTLAALSTGNGHDGNSNGNLMYRRVMDNGAWKMQWKGGISFGGSTSLLSTPLDTIYAPATKQSCHSPRSAVSTSGGNSIGLDFMPNGTVVIVGATWNTTSTSSNTSAASPGTDSQSPGTDTAHGQHHHPGGTGGDGYTGWQEAAAGADYTYNHNHTVNSHSHTVASHWHNLNGHYHTAQAPDWISFAGVEYFLG